MKKNSRKKNIEVEIRALINNISKLRKKLEKSRATYKGEFYLRDIYFCNKSYDSLKDVEMDDVGSYGLRLRKSKDEKGKWKITLNVKAITSKGDHNAWEEREIEVSNLKEAAKILLLTEFKPFFELEKTRYHYTQAGLDIFLENISDFGSCIEIEKMVERGMEDKAKKKIISFLEQLGINNKSIVPKSVTNIIMQKRAFKSKIKI